MAFGVGVEVGVVTFECSNIQFLHFCCHSTQKVAINQTQINVVQG